MTITSTAPVIRITLRLRSASGPTLFTKMCGPRKATAPKQMKVKKGNMPVGIVILGDAANVAAQWRAATGVQVQGVGCILRFIHVSESFSN